MFVAISLISASLAALGIYFIAVALFLYLFKTFLDDMPNPFEAKPVNAKCEPCLYSGMKNVKAVTFRKTVPLCQICADYADSQANTPDSWSVPANGIHPKL